MSSVFVHETFIEPGIPAIVVENQYIIVTFLPDKGSDIYRIQYKPKGAIDILYRTPWGPRAPGGTLRGSSEMQWMDDYPGGWQLLFPNAGSDCEYKGAEQGFHGEASTRAWRYQIDNTQEGHVRIVFHVVLSRTPFELLREFTISPTEAAIRLQETVMNTGGETMDYVWCQHIAFGEPFLGEKCYLHTPNRIVRSDETQGGQSRLSPGTETSWPICELADGRTGDLGQVLPKHAGITEMSYLIGMEDGWYVLSNPELELNAGVGWDLTTFPYVWLWQEFCGSFGYPFYGRTYCMGVEPCSTPIQDGLAESARRGYAFQIEPGQKRQTDVAFVLFEGTESVKGITATGEVKR